MKSYLDRTWAVAAQTIIHYSGRDASVEIPGRFADMKALAIGAGAFMDAVDMHQVGIPPEVRRIGAQAFKNCGNLRNVYMPGTLEQIDANAFGNCRKILNVTVYDLPLSLRAYEDLCLSCSVAEGSMYVAHVFPDIGILRNALAAMECRPAASVPFGIEKLFLSKDLSEDVGRASLTRNLERFEFGGGAGDTTEEEAFLRLIGTGERAPVFDKKTEAANDTFARLERYPMIERTAVFTFDDERTRAEGENRWITANIKIGYHFFQAMVPMFYKGKEYFVYCRHYLTPASDLRYIRRDTAVFTKKGLVTERGEAEEVSAKYKLLSIL